MSQKTLHRTLRPTLRRCARLPARLVAFCLASVMCVSTHVGVNAAVQGPFGFGSSTGSVDVDLIIGFRARISGLADMPLGDWSGTGPMTANDNICVGVNYFGGGYRIRASGDGEPGDPGAFTLSNGANRITYNAFFNDATGVAGRVPLTGGVTLNGQNAANLPRVFNFFFGCVANNANVSIEVPESELTGGFGTYNGTLTLTLLPE